jgi:hypothetical protein
MQFNGKHCELVVMEIQYLEVIESEDGRRESRDATV